MNRIARATALGLALSVAAVPAALAQDTTTTETQVQNTLWAQIQANPDLSTLASLIEAAGLQDALNGTEQYTLLAPTNEALAALPQEQVDFLIANPDILAEVLRNHLIVGAADSATVANLPTLQTAAGGELQVQQGEDGSLTVSGAQVTEADLMADNGVIHEIDMLIAPVGGSIEQMMGTEGAETDMGEDSQEDAGEEGDAEDQDSETEGGEGDGETQEGEGN